MKDNLLKDDDYRFCRRRRRRRRCL